MRIPLCDLKRQIQDIAESIYSTISEVIDGTKFILGSEVDRFEKNFAFYCGSKYCSGVDNATDGIMLALEAMGVKEGDEVILPTFTVTADYEAVVNAGAVPVLSDVGKNGCITLDEIKKRVTSKTVAVIVVHMFGNPCDIVEICEYAKENNIAVIEDCSHAHGLKINGKCAGTFGDFGVFSFFPSKILGCLGDGGAVITDSYNNNEIVKALSNHGRLESEKHTHTYCGYNCRLDELQAAILNVKLIHLDRYVQYRRLIYQKYMLSLPKTVDVLNTVESVNYVFVLKCDNRESLKKHLNDNGISTGYHYPVPIHRIKFYNGPKDFPVSDDLSESVLSIPMFPELKEEEQDYIIEKINQYYEV